MNLTGKHILFVGSSTGIDDAIKNQLKLLGADIIIYEKTCYYRP